MNYKLKIITLVFFSIFSLQSRALAHGTKINYQSTEAIVINSAYDTGEPMAGAKITVFAPNDSSNPWLTGSSDKKGRFFFQPDTSKPGNWKVRVSQAGHGGVVEVPVTGKTPENSAKTKEINSSQPAFVKTQPTNTSDYTLPQKGLMIGSTIWGCIGTALFFTRRKYNAHS